jgi:hypothetical protein
MKKSTRRIMIILIIFFFVLGLIFFIFPGIIEQVLPVTGSGGSGLPGGIN